jgi:hypothetical protein
VKAETNTHSRTDHAANQLRSHNQDVDFAYLGAPQQAFHMHQRARGAWHTCILGLATGTNTVTVTFTSPAPTTAGAVVSCTSEKCTGGSVSRACATACRNCTTMAPNESGDHPSSTKLKVMPTLHRPPGQGVHSPAPALLKLPAGHSNAVAVTEPAGHAYPAVHRPLHRDEFMPMVAPKRPAGQKPLQVGRPRAGESPYRPAGHMVHADDPATLNWPAGHCTAVELTDPAGHTYPGEHAPLHAGELEAGTLPKVPAGQLLHEDAPAKLYWPTGHADAVADVDPAGHAYPGLHAQRHDKAPTVKSSNTRPASACRKSHHSEGQAGGGGKRAHSHTARGGGHAHLHGPEHDASCSTGTLP